MSGCLESRDATGLVDTDVEGADDEEAVCKMAEAEADDEVGSSARWVP